MSAAILRGQQRVFAHRPFVLFWVSRLLSGGSNHFLAVAVGWQLYDLTGDPLDLGLVGLAHFVPTFALTLLVGQVADRSDRRLVIATCRGVQLVVVGGLAASSLIGVTDRTMILSAVALVGAARAFEDPTMSAMLPGLVPRELLSRATALAATANQMARIGGPSVAGFLYLLGPSVVYVGTAAFLGVACVMAALIPPTPRSGAREPISTHSLLAGVTYVWNTPIVLGAISLDLFVVLLGGATALLPAYARDILETGPWGLGLLRAAPGLGAVAMSLYLARFVPTYPVGIALLSTVSVFGLATIIFGLSTSLALSLGALVIMGAANAISVVIRHSLVQLWTPDARRGRVSAVNAMFTGTSNHLGDFESGVTAAWFGVVPAVVIGGVGTIVVAVLWALWFPQLRRLETLER
ncbi:MAG: MFS transporter [Chloroflexota bacterium]